MVKLLCFVTFQRSVSESFRDRVESSWVVISRVIGRVTILITHIRVLMTLLITTRRVESLGKKVFRAQGLGAGLRRVRFRLWGHGAAAISNPHLTAQSPE